MISGKHFKVEIGHDDQGLTVTVTHVPTGRQRFDHPGQGEGIGALQERLKSDLLFGFFDEKDFVCECGRCSVEGQFGDYYRVVHLPTNRSKQMDSVTSPGVKNHYELLIDLLVEELWREGLLPKKVEGVIRPHQIET